MTTLRTLTKEAGRNPDMLQVTIIVDPRESGPSLDEMKRYRDAGANRIEPRRERKRPALPLLLKKLLLLDAGQTERRRHAWVRHLSLIGIQASPQRGIIVERLQPFIGQFERIG